MFTACAHEDAALGCFPVIALRRAPPVQKPTLALKSLLEIAGAGAGLGLGVGDRGEQHDEEQDAADDDIAGRSLEAERAPDLGLAAAGEAEIGLAGAGQAEREAGAATLERLARNRVGDRESRAELEPGDGAGVAASERQGEGSAGKGADMAGREQPPVGPCARQGCAATALAAAKARP